MCALEQHIARGVCDGPQGLHDVPEHWSKLARPLLDGLEDWLGISGRLPKPMLKKEIVVVKKLVDTFVTRLQLRQLADADAPASDLVLVRRTNSSAGCANGLTAPSSLSRLIQSDMARENHGASRTDGQSASGSLASLLQRLELLDQRIRGNDHPVADHALNVWSQDPGRHQVKYRFFPINNKSVACVMSTLESNHRLAAVRQ